MRTSLPSCAAPTTCARSACAAVWCARSRARCGRAFDVLAAPSLGTPAIGVTDDLDTLPADPDPLGAIGNLAGLPAISIAAGFVGGLPLGVQLVGPPLAEAMLVQLAQRHQTHTDWHRRRPPL